MITDRYDDGGISGGTLGPLALQKMLADIEAGRIDIVAVYQVLYPLAARLCVVGRQALKVLAGVLAVPDPNDAAGCWICLSSRSP